jgi:hypothetical protein
MAEQQVKVYPILPASTTGDLWHLASAAILNKQYDSLNNPRGLHIIPVIFMYEEATLTPEELAARPILNENQAEVEKQRNAGVMTFNFLKDLRLDCLLVIVKGSDMKNSSIQTMLYSQDDSFFDQLYTTQASQPDYQQMDLQGTINQAKRYQDQPNYGVVQFQAASKDIVAPIPGKRSLHYHAATTAAMMTLAEAKSRRDRLGHLQEGLNPSWNAISGPQMTKAGVDSLAKEKLDDLEKQMLALRAGDNNRIIIYNNRGNDVNDQTSSTVAIFEAFRKLVESPPYNMRIVVINTGGPDLGYEPVLDLFNKKRVGSFHWAGLDPIVTCRFWNQLSKLSKAWGVFGMFSGRSGSCDVAAFNGFNCFYWDTPYLDLAAYDEGVFGSFGISRDEARNYEVQGPAKLVELIPLQIQCDKKIGDVQKDSEIKDKGGAIKALKTALNAAKEAKMAEIVNAPAGWDTRGGLRNEALNQLAQTYRTLQQFLIMGVGYPANIHHTGVVSKAAWQGMRKNPLEEWLNGASFLEQPLFPRCPEILISKDVVLSLTDPDPALKSMKTWVYWKNAPNQKKLPVSLPFLSGRSRSSSSPNIHLPRTPFPILEALNMKRKVRAGPFTQMC